MVWLTVHISNIVIFKSIYFTNCNSNIKYGIISGVNSSNSGKIFTLQKKIMRRMAVAPPKTSCSSLFKQLREFTCPRRTHTFIKELHCQQSVTFTNNSSIHNINTRHKHYFHRQNGNPSHLKKSAFHARIRTCNNLPQFNIP